MMQAIVILETNNYVRFLSIVKRCNEDKKKIIHLEL